VFCKLWSTTPLSTGRNAEIGGVKSWKFVLAGYGNYIFRIFKKYKVCGVFNRCSSVSIRLYVVMSGQRKWRGFGQTRGHHPAELAMLALEIASITFIIESQICYELNERE
jgi:hypothetical protein